MEFNTYNNGMSSRTIHFQSIKDVRFGFLSLAMCLAVLMCTSVAQSENDSVTNISVYGLKSINLSQELADMLQEHLESNLLEYEQFNVLTRTDVDLILDENRFQQTGTCSGEECLVQAGHLLGVEMLVTGTLSRIGNTYNVVLKLIDIRTGKLEASANRKHTGSVDRLLDITEELLNELIPDTQEPVEDTVVTTGPAAASGPPAEMKSPVARREEIGLQFTNHSPAPPAKPTPPSKTAKLVGRGAMALFGAIAVLVIAYQFTDS